MCSSDLVRVSGKDEAKIQEIFGEVELFNDVAEGECGFVTGEMTEEQYRRKAAEAGNVITMIRMD